MCFPSPTSGCTTGLRRNLVLASRGRLCFSSHNKANRRCWRRKKPLGRICGTTDLWRSHQSSRGWWFSVGRRVSAGGFSFVPHVVPGHFGRNYAWASRLSGTGCWWRRRPALCSWGLQVPLQPQMWPFRFLSQECSVRCFHVGPSAREKNQKRWSQREAFVGANYARHGDTWFRWYLSESLRVLALKLHDLRGITNRYGSSFDNQHGPQISVSFRAVWDHGRSSSCALRWEYGLVKARVSQFNYLINIL